MNSTPTVTDLIGRLPLSRCIPNEINFASLQDILFANICDLNSGQLLEHLTERRLNNN